MSWEFYLFHLLVHQKRCLHSLGGENKKGKEQKHEL